MDEAEVLMELLKKMIICSDSTQSARAVSRMDEINILYPHNRTIAYRYADGLLNFAKAQELSVKEKTIKRLHDLYEGFLTETSAVQQEMFRFGLGLSYHFASVFGESYYKNIAIKVKKLMRSQTLGFFYAKGLYHLSCSQELAEKIITVEKLRELWKENCMEFMKNIIRNPVTEHAAWISNRDETLHYPNLQIALEYAKSLLNLSVSYLEAKNLAGCKGTVERLGFLYEELCGEREIAMEYAKGLVNLSLQSAYEKELPACRLADQKLCELLETNEGDERISKLYQIGQLALRWAEGEEQTLDELKKLFAEVKQTL
jgi:hypothetical protein